MHRRFIAQSIISLFAYFDRFAEPDDHRARRMQIACGQLNHANGLVMETPGA